jgi:hypothetical protein
MTKDTWIENNKPFYLNNITTRYYHIIYLLIPFCTIFLSYSIHKYRFKFKEVRICCDISSFIGILWSAFLLITFHKPDKLDIAILRNFFSYGIFQGLIVFCDAYMFYKSYSVLVKIPRWKVQMIFTYVWIVLILSWNLKWNLIPFFCTPENVMYINSFYYLDLISYYGVIFYNLLFTIAFVRELVKHYSLSYIINLRIRNRMCLLIINGIGHCITSSFANLYRTLNTTDLASFPIWMFIVGMNLWFNIKIELFWTYISNQESKIHKYIYSTKRNSTLKSCLMNISTRKKNQKVHFKRRSILPIDI